MQIYGIDFTSRPNRSKSITCLDCTLLDGHLRANTLQEWRSFQDFEAALQLPGAWIAGIDFPFGQARRFIETIGWPQSWQDYVDHVAGMSREEFRNALDNYRAARPSGDKEHRRKTDIATGSISPQKLYGTPVGLMFFEGAPRIKQAGVTIPNLQSGDPDRIVVEAYPGVLARHLIGRRSYKHDTKAKQTTEQYQTRKDIINAIKQGALTETHGLTIEANDCLINDAGADHLDSLLCAIQAAWSWTQRAHNYGAPSDGDALEGWIAHPTLQSKPSGRP